MPKTKKRANVKNLPKTKKELTPEQAKRVKGGLFGDGSVRFIQSSIGTANITDGTSNTLLNAEKK